MNSLGIRFRRSRQDDPSVMLDRAKNGDDEARNQLIQDYTPFVLKVASQKTGRFLRPGIDEEISVALLAFNEAISSYDGKRGSFLSFSQTVIQRRLVDYFRRNRGRRNEVTFSEFDDEAGEQPDSNPLDKLAHASWGMQQEQEARRQEIEEYKEMLHRFEIRFEDLVEVAPKHRDARARAIGIARSIARHDQYREGLMQRAELPVKKLVEEFGVSRKLVERNRKYIIAVAIILMHDFPFLQGYVLNQ